MVLKINSPRIVHEIIDNELILIDFDSGAYYSTRDEGARIWEMIERGASSEDIVKAMADGRPPKEAGDVEAAVQRFLDEMIGEGLILADETGRSHAPPADPPAPVASEFSAPALRKFTDMEELLLLDPIHEVNDAGWPIPK
ncbi:MAG: PqqD family protein [Desulfobacterales bacterium]|nr:PqqD family protein [Desulfobacterales bacterium]